MQQNAKKMMTVRPPINGMFVKLIVANAFIKVFFLSLELKSEDFSFSSHLKSCAQWLELEVVA